MPSGFLPLQVSLAPKFPQSQRHRDRNAPCMSPSEPCLQTLRAFSILSTSRPSLLRRDELAPLPALSSHSGSTQPALDLLPRISTHPSLASIQVRNGPRDTYNPSHRVRKRRAGFLARFRTRKGRMILKRRQLKGRSTLSH